MAEAFRAEGARVVLNDIDPQACAEAAQRCGGHSVPGDAASVEGVQRLIAESRDFLGGIDVFCANAGVELGGGDSDEVWERTWEVNVMAHVRAFRELQQEWLERGEGRFIATVSAAGLLLMPGAAAYTATKHAALAYAEWLSVTYGDRGIVVQALCPLGVRTDMARTDTPHGEIVLAPTLIEPEQVAQTVLEALDDDRFLVLPHPQVADFEVGKASDRQKWLAGMRRVQREIDALGARNSPSTHGGA